MHTQGNVHSLTSLYMQGYVQLVSILPKVALFTAYYFMASILMGCDLCQISQAQSANMSAQSANTRAQLYACTT